MKRVLLVNPFERLPGEDFRDQRYTALYRHLKQHADVRWISCTFHHWSHTARTAAMIPEEDRDRVVLIPAPPYRKNVSLRRALSYAVMSWRTARYLSEMAFKPDVILCCGPVEMEFLLVRWARRHSIPVIVDVVDTWPDLFVKAFPRTLRWLGFVALSPLFAMSHYVFRKATQVTAVSRTYAEWARRRAGAPEGMRTSWYYLGADDTSALRPERKPESPLRCLFAGQFGFNYDLDTVIEAARICERAGTSIEFILAGDGYKGASLRAKARGLANVTFPGWLPTSRLLQLAADCHIGLNAYTTEATQSVPTKFFDYLAMGLYVINSLPGETAELLEQYGVGASYTPGDAEGLAALLQAAAMDVPRISAAGAEAHQVFVRNYRFSDIYRRMAGELLDC